MPLHSAVIIQDARREIVDTLLTLISMLGQGACRLPFYLSRWPILLVRIVATMRPFDCWMGITINGWCSVDTHLWAHLRHILTVIDCSTIVQKMHTVFNGSQYTASRYYHVNPRSSRHLSFWANTIHSIFVKNNVALSCFSAFGRRYTTWESMNEF